MAICCFSQGVLGVYGPPCAAARHTVCKGEPPRERMNRQRASACLEACRSATLETAPPLPFPQGVLTASRALEREPAVGDDDGRGDRDTPSVRAAGAVAHGT